MRIRKATAKDFAEILKLELKWEKEGVCWGVEHPSKKELIKHIKKDIVYVAEEGGKLIGHVIGKIIKAKEFLEWASIKKGQKYGLIEGMYVVKNYRKKGVGALLMKSLMNNFKKKGLKAIRLKAVSKNLRELVRFYERFGFQEKMSDMVARTR
jgi:GNAT superfamily N-acetyltransferase